MGFLDHLSRDTQDLMGVARRMAKTKKSAVTIDDSTTSAHDDHQQNCTTPALPAPTGNQGLIPPTLVICRNKYAYSGNKSRTQAPVTDQILGIGDTFPPTMAHGSTCRAKCLKA